MKIQRVAIVVAILLVTLCLSSESQVTFSVDPAVTIAKPDSHFIACIDVQGVTPAMAVSSIQFTLTFDTCVVFWDGTMTFQQTCLDSAGWHITVHNETYTDLDVWILGGQLLDCNGCILKIGFLINSHCVEACGGDSTLLHFDSVVINEGTPQATTHDGLVIVNRGPYFTSPEDGSSFHVTEGPDEGCDTLCYLITAEDPDGDGLTLLWLANDSTAANGAVLDSLAPGTWRYCWAPPKRPGNSLADNCYPDTFVVYSTCGAGGIASASCCFDTIVVSACVDSLHLHAFWPDTNFHACGRIEIPVYLETNYGFCFEDLNIYSLYLELTYDSEYLNVFEVGNEGLITENMGPLTYAVNEALGLVTVSMALNSELTGCDMPSPIMYVGFQIAGGTEAGSSLELGIEHIKINEAYPRICWEGGLVDVISYSIEGDVFYSDNFEPIPGAEVGIWIDDPTMTPPPDDTVYTDGVGHYMISSILGCSDYCVSVDMEPLEMPDPTQVITSLDAAYILMFIAGTRVFSHNDSLAADITGDGTISAYDVAKLLQAIVGLNTGLHVGQWIFEPAYRCYNSLAASRSDEEYEGVIIGDVTQNWPNTGAPKSGLVIGPDVIVDQFHPASPPVEEKEDDEEEIEFFFTFPIAFKSVDGIIAAEFGLTYDAEVLEAVDACTTGLSAGFFLEYNILPGKIRIAMAGAAPMSGSGAVAEVLFKATSEEIDLQMYVKLNERTVIILPYPIKIVTERTPREYALYENYPNPFNPQTAISYQLSAVSEQTTNHSPLVTLKIYNVLGQEIRTLVNKTQGAGVYTVTWNGKDDTGRKVGSGVYFYRLSAGEYTSTKRMLLLK